MTGLVFTPTGPKHTQPGQAWRDPLDRNEWLTRPVPHKHALALIRRHHYSAGGPNTSVIGRS